MGTNSKGNVGLCNILDFIKECKDILCKTKLAAKEMGFVNKKNKQKSTMKIQSIKGSLFKHI